MFTVLTQYGGSILGPIAKVLGWIMNLIYNLMYTLFGTGNIALSIIIFTIVVYMLLLPLTWQQQKFSVLQRKMKPELDAIQKKYKGKRDQNSMLAQQEEQQALYDKYGVSMSGSCVNLVIQMPLLFALYRVFMNIPAYITSVKDIFGDLVTGIMGTEGYADAMQTIYTEANLRTITVDFTTTDSTAMGNYIIDVLYKLSASGWQNLQTVFPGLTDVITSTHAALEKINYFLVLNISDTPLNQIKSGWESKNFLLIFCALLIPAANYGFQLLSIKMTPTQSGGENDQMAQQMKTMNIMMPLMSLFIGFSVPVGLGLYWAMGALVRSVQSFFLNRHFEKIDLDAIIEKNREKAAKKAEKRGERRDIYAAATTNTRNGSLSSRAGISEDQAAQLDRADAARRQAASGSLAAKANLVRDYNEGKTGGSKNDQ